MGIKVLPIKIKFVSFLSEREGINAGSYWRSQTTGVGFELLMSGNQTEALSPSALQVVHELAEVETQIQRTFIVDLSA